MGIQDVRQGRLRYRADDNIMTSGLLSGRIEKHEMEEIISILFELNGYSAVILLLKITFSPGFITTI